MPSEENKKLQLALAPALKTRGFTKERATWRKPNAGSICVLNLQGSQWGPSFYVNLGVYFRALGTKNSPTEYHCHLRARLTDLVSERERVNDLLDFEKTIPPEVRFKELEEAILSHGIPWLDRVSTIPGARGYCLDAKAPRVTGDASQLLGLSSGV